MEILGIPWLTLVSRLHEESVGSTALPGRLYSSVCNQTRTLSWISRVAGEIVFQPLQSDTDALLHEESAMQLFLSVGSDVLPETFYPAFPIRHGRSLHEESAMQLFLFGGTRAD